MQKRTKKIAVIGLTVALVAGGGGAFAYWTINGSGAGSASTGSVDGSITVHQTSIVSDLRPGGAAQSLEGDFTNTDDSPAFVDSVTASIESVVPVEEGGDCEINDYVLANPVVQIDTEIQSGAHVGSWEGPTLRFNNEANENQDGCQGATVNIAYDVN